MSEGEAISDWGRYFGLAIAPLFGSGDPSPPTGEHNVLLDGGLGTFAISSTEEEIWRERTPAAWAWSSDIAHHVTLTSSKVAVVRWDKPDDARVFTRESVEKSLDKFYAYLTEDRLRSSRGVVDHLLGFFRRLRSLTNNVGIGDDRTTEVFSAALAQLIAPDAAKSNPSDFGLTEDSLSLCARLDERGLRAALEEIESATGSLSLLKLHPTLAIRHAGGQLFQEAHFDLLRTSPNVDLFGLVDAPEVRVDSRGGTHFTPPALARIIVEQALQSIPDLHRREELVLCDPACGSGAFLHECLRALQRFGFNGRLKLVGHDISAAAIAMAKFVLSMSLRDWKPAGGVTLVLRDGDSLGELGIPPSDVIVMNPPFIAFGAQTASQRDQLREATDESASRGDYSMAFVVRAVEALNDGGVLGTLFPASLLSLKAASGWRARLAASADVQLIASIGDFGLFSHALVQVACAVIRKATPKSQGEFTAVVTENDPVATSVALRQLRKLDGRPPATDLMESGWSIFSVKGSSLVDRSTWRLPNPSEEKLLRSLGDLGFPTVGELFEVSQGVQTGLNEVLLLNESEWRALPVRERQYFRLATMTDSISNGHVTKPYYVFYPHTAEGMLFADEEGVKQSLPTYFAKYLEPHRVRLTNRAAIVRSKRSDWWGLMEPRSSTWACEKRPRIITKFFSAEGGFVPDLEAEYLPVMGHVWRPRQRLASADAEDLPMDQILCAYAALFNTSEFTTILSLYSPHVAGGQFDLSQRYVSEVPVPNFRDMSGDLRGGRMVAELATLGHSIDLADSSWRFRTQSLVSSIYGTNLFNS